jgi:hypothetical protein
MVHKIAIQGFLIFLAMAFINCDSKQKNNKEVINNLNSKTRANYEEASVCNILSKEYLIKTFPGASNFKPFSKEKPYPSCSYRFEYNGENHKVGLTLVKKYASEKNLDKAVSYFKDIESLKGIGKKAYFIPPQGQVSLFNNNYLAHVYVTINEKGNKDLAIQIAKELIEKIDN